MSFNDDLWEMMSYTLVIEIKMERKKQKMSFKIVYCFNLDFLVKNFFIHYTLHLNLIEFYY